MLDEGVLRHEGLELGGGDEVVVRAVGFAGAGGAGRVGDAEAEGAGVGGEEARYQGGFAGAGGAGVWRGMVREGGCLVKMGGKGEGGRLTLRRLSGVVGEGDGRWEPLS